MEHKATLQEAIRVLEERSNVYGTVEQSFERAAGIATLMLDRVVTPHEIVNVMIAVKLARAAVNPFHTDSYVDAINYMAFAAEFVETLGNNAPPPPAEP